MRRQIALWVLFLSAFLAAQDVRLGEVGGEILDMVGRPIANADVVYTNAGNGRTYRCKTGPDGRFFMIGLLLGRYNVKITGPNGRLIYTESRPVFAEDHQDLNIIHFDASIIPTKASLAPFRGPTAADIQGQQWRKRAEAGEFLSPAQEAQLREENRLIVRYNELTPEVKSALKRQDWKKAAELLQQMIAGGPAASLSGAGLFQPLRDVLRHQRNGESIGVLRTGHPARSRNGRCLVCEGHRSLRPGSASRQI